MIPLADAQRLVLAECAAPLPPRPVALDGALGRVVSEDVVAKAEVPPFANSSMDGYAVRAADTAGAPVQLRVIGSVGAGHLFDGVVGPGQALRIMTGAPFPTGADAVCMVEHTECDGGGVVKILHAVEPGQFVRLPGRDVPIGALVVRAGTALTPAHLGDLANQGVAQVMVYPHPRVGVLSTGDELFSGSGVLPPGQIRDANRHSLLALIRREAWVGVDLGIVADDAGAVADSLAGAAGCDAVVTTGGVSVGDSDLVRVALERLSGGTMRWLQVAIRPAKPLAFGRLKRSGTPVFGLPGNPVSSVVSFELFVRPALRMLGGHLDLHRPVVPAVSEEELIRTPDGKLHLLRGWARLDRGGGWHVRAAIEQDSNQLHALATSNTLIAVPDGHGCPAGVLIDTMLIDPGGLSNVEGPVLNLAGVSPTAISERVPR